MKIVFAGILVLILASFSDICSAGKCDQSEVYRKCNHKAAQVHVHGPHPSRLHHQIYCKGVQALIECLSEDRCDGSFIKNYRFLVLQASIMSRKTICPNLHYRKLKKLTAGVARRLNLPDLEPLSAKGDVCAKGTFLKCALVYSLKLEKKHNICNDFLATILCFRKQKKKCSSAILSKYREILRKLGIPLIGSAKKHAAEMCF